MKNEKIIAGVLTSEEYCKYLEESRHLILVEIDNLSESGEIT